MLSQNPFYWGSIRKVVVAFGSLFSDLHIVRVDDGGNPIKTIKVPLSYGPKEKYLVRALQNPMPNQDDQVELVLPRCSYEITGFIYDDSRKLTSTGRTVKALTTTNSMLKTQFNPVPYNIGFQLNVMTKTIEDSLMIVEQILPFFTPDFTITVNDIPALDLKKDLPIVLNGISSEDTYDGQFSERRTITFTLNFTVKAYLYPPVKLAQIILSSETVFHQGDQSDPASSGPEIIVAPDPTSAFADEDFGITTTIKEQSILVLVLPSTASLSANQTKQFGISMLNASDPSVTFTLTPNIGTFDPFGLYTAPSNIAVQTLLTLRITSVEDPNRWSDALITLTP